MSLLDLVILVFIVSETCKISLFVYIVLSSAKGKVTFILDLFSDFESNFCLKVTFLEFKFLKLGFKFVFISSSFLSIVIESNGQNVCVQSKTLLTV